MSFDLDTPTSSRRGRTALRVLGSTALGLVALISFESIASALPPKLRRQQQQPAVEAPAAEATPEPSAPPAVEPPAAPPAAEPPPAPNAAELPSDPPPAAPATPAHPTAEFPPPPAAEPSPELPAALPPPAPSTPLAAEPRAAEPPPATAGAYPTPVMLGAPPDRAMDRAEAERSGSDSSDKPRQFGAMLDLGVPDGTMLSFVYRPVEMARFHAGAGYNGISPGLRLGGVFLPFGWGPALELDYGHYFEGDANGLVGLFGDTSDGRVLLQKIGYDYVNFRLGMDFGGERFTFFAHGGISYLRTTIHEFDSLLGDGASASNTTIEIRQDPVLSAWVPNLQLGFIVHL